MSKNFSIQEFASPGVSKGKRGGPAQPVPDIYVKNVEHLCDATLEVVREACGGNPVHVISGWRSQEYNRLNAGRAKNSLHLVGKAADIVVKGCSPAVVFWVCKDLMSVGKIPVGGLACYPTFVHVDTRGTPARWRPAPKRPATGPGSKGWLSDA